VGDGVGGKQTREGECKREKACVRKGMKHIVREGVEARLERMGLFSLEQRRLTGILMEVFDTMKGVDRVNEEKVFAVCRRLGNQRDTV